MKRCIMHLGHPKTATTYLQTTLHLNEELLREQGYWVPSDFKRFGSYDYKAIAEAAGSLSGNLQPVFDAAEAKDTEQIDRLMHYILTSTDCNLILSSELLFYYSFLTKGIISRANDAGFSVDVTVFLARQDRAVVPNYLQNVRNHGVYTSILDFLDRNPVKRFFRYAEVLASYDVMPPNRIVVRTFEPQFLVQSDIIADFVRVAECPVIPSVLRRPVATVNTGLPLEWCELLRGLNAAGHENRIRKLREAAPALDVIGRKRLMDYYFSNDVRDHILANYMGGNQTLIAEYLADRSDVERAYWQSVNDAGQGASLDPRLTAECLDYLFDGSLA